ncbi:MAG: T9SS type A sorting domain-containing protein [Ignavibacteriaceae bacterium]|nr:T9SS type A sorting domain-containing protein [Ignavibacteriaceae bacterium]
MLRSILLSTFYFLLFTFNSSLFGQWITNSELNTQLVFDSANPVNISSLEDGNGGAFLFWQDAKSNSQTDVYFLHFDNDGNVSFRADGKSVSTANGEKKNPLAAGNNSHNAVVLWNDFSSANRGALYGQLVKSNGTLVWGDFGLKIAGGGQNTLVNCGVALDQMNTSYFTHVEKSDAAPTEYYLTLQIVSETGAAKFSNDGMLISKSFSAKNNSTVFPDEKGGCFVLWGESENKIYQIHAQYVDERGKLLWKEVVDVSGHATSITGYHALLAKPGLLYVYWQNLGRNKTISHQLLTSSGKTLLEERRKTVTKQKGNQVNPQAVLAGDSTLMLSWVKDLNGRKNIYIQKFKTNGNPVWNSEGISVAKTKGDQFGQAIVSGEKNGAILAWFDKTEQSQKPIVFAQKISVKKELLWNEEGTPVALDKKSDKSYLSLFSDQKGGVIVLFKENRKEGTGIYGQRLFSAKALVSQITDFSAKVVADSVQLSWTVTNESDLFTYKIEKMNEKDAVENIWQSVVSVYSSSVGKTNDYTATEPLEVAGTVYFRLSQIGRDGKKNFSAIEKITFAPVNAEENYVVQNSPNPFSGKTTIVFHLTNPNEVKLEIFNSRIEKIKELFLTDTQTGKNKFVFDGSALTPGIYFYRFTSGDFVDVKKMVVTKK